MSGPKFSLVLLMLLVFASNLFVFANSREVSEDEATSALTNANEAVVSAYQVILEAEKTGANVSGLVGRLNEASVLLAEGQVALRTGDFEKAVRSANLGYEIGQNVKNQANELGGKAYGPWVMRLWLVMTGSLVGAIVVALVSFWGWRFFKRRYYERVLKMRPEVSPDES